MELCRCVEITRIGTKFKMSQEMGEKDSVDVSEGLANFGTEAGSEIARIVAERQELDKPVS
ncbi:uncharacterized protein N7458_004863 [Penicillium daleae]|uniref:Uncharacterized protein n=1 Tax=Penicillium daleae TaxID=63821 RepID=A0AAD6C9L3_9EURO|nr:uncharacterized protein N7458_004863 [Penicillium daleae]KAJ5453907.1 hypothetical protein N7458_004863 [Penicillium daleae]